ncbi:MAG: DUF429 domain-containing protein [Deltaproteobacteria bacterium]|nr:DUF429 domain-containing protein [Deltaproteobacteria bacterium]
MSKTYNSTASTSGGAQDAGNKTWIARGVPNNDKLIIHECFKARDLPNSGRRLRSCLPALVNLIKNTANAAFGMDFPFGLHTSLIREHTWDEFVLAFSSRYMDPEDFKRKCFVESGNRELRRRTDDKAQTPFSPYNLRLYKQTYYGISKVLLPVVKDKSARILPFHKPILGKALILEICPTSTLKAMGLTSTHYKGRDDNHRKNRQKMLKSIERKSQIKIEKSEIMRKITEDKGGDALDSVIAALATFNATHKKSGSIPYEDKYSIIEGYVYF